MHKAAIVKMAATFVSVLLDQSLSKPLDYSVPVELQSLVQIGMRVEVPLRKSLAKGTISAIKPASDFPNVKPLKRLLSERVELADSLWKLAEWMAHYYATPLQRVLRSFIPPNIRREIKPKTQLFLTLLKSGPETLLQCQQLRSKHPAQAQILEELLNAKKGLYLSDLLRRAGLSRAPVDALVKKKLVASQIAVANDQLLLEEEFFPTKPKTLTGEQSGCLTAIQASLSSGLFATHLIHGVTGSGKTEIYLQAIQSTLDMKKSALLLVPEISLTSQTIERLRARFAQKIAVLHHKKSLGERTAAWENLRMGEVALVLGARSAIFCPVQNLGLIIVDEEHDPSYKQSDEQPCYHARDIAVMRAHLENAVVVLGSATPSLESRYNASLGKYHFHTLSVRPTHAPMPSVRIVDLKKSFDVAGGFTHFSEELLDGIKKRLELGEQTLLFLNRRGYHRMQLCANCRFIAKCPHCDLHLTYHRNAQELRCHLCNHSRSAHRDCPQCQSPQALQFKGFGTEHVERSLHAIFPDIRLLRMDRDTTQRKNSHEELFQQFRAHKADVLIGTQMIAKGFHFPAVTLVGILNLDASLTIPDFRAPEQTFQLLTQVAGRSGRSELPGEVILQTFFPDHPIIHLAANQDYSTFYASELEERRLFGYPPFCHLIKLLFTSPDEQTAQKAAETAHGHLKPLLPPFAQLLPVSPAGHPKIKDLFRFQFLIKTAKIGPLSPLLTSLAPSQVKIDIDPLYTFF